MQCATWAANGRDHLGLCARQCIIEYVVPIWNKPQRLVFEVILGGDGSVLFQVSTHPLYPRDYFVPTPLHSRARVPRVDSQVSYYN